MPVDRTPPQASEDEAGADGPVLGSAHGPELGKVARVVVADPSYLVRGFLAEVLSAAPEVELVAVCTNGKEALFAIETWHPDILITAVRMPPSGIDEGIRVAARLRASEPEVGVLVLSHYVEAEWVLSLFQQGTSRRGYLLKEHIRDNRELLDAIRTVAHGGSVIDPLVVDVLIQARQRESDSPMSGLSRRERELLAEIAQGKSNASIADSLCLTKRAVEKHVNSIFAKLQLRDTEDISPRVKAALIYLSAEGELAPLEPSSAQALRRVR